jgi:HrpA-like RNA helicase
MIVDSHRLGAGEEAADIAAILTERGLGGDSVDLDARLDQFRRDRSPRASSARSLAQRWAQQVASTEGPPGEDISPSTGIMLALAFPDRVARNRGNGSFVLANGRGAAVEQTSSLARAPYIAGRRTDRHRRPRDAFCWRRRSRRKISKRASPIRSRTGKRFRSIAARWRCAGAASGRCTRSRCRKRRSRCRPRRRPRASSPRDWSPPGSTSCRGRNP